MTASREARAVWRVDGGDQGAICATIEEVRDLLGEWFPDAPEEVADAIARVPEDAALAILDVTVAPVPVVDLEDDQWWQLVWEACRAGGTWDEGGGVTVTTVGLGGAGSGLSRVNPSIRGCAFHVTATRGASRAEVYVDGLVQSVADIRRVVTDVRTAEAMRAVERTSMMLADAQATLDRVKREHAVAVREALEEGARAEGLAEMLGVSRARVYQLRDGRR